MNDNQDMNQTNESVDLEKTQVISSEEINQVVQAPVAEPVAATPVETPAAEPVAVAPVETPVVEPAAVAPVETPAAEPVAVAPVETPVAEPVAATPVETPVVEPVAVAPVQEQTVIESISGQTNTDAGIVQNIVEGSQVEVTNPEAAKPEEKVYKDPSKLSTVLVILLFIALFVFVFEMPKINNWLETRKQNSEIDEIGEQAKRIEEENNKKEAEKKAKEQQAIQEEEKKEATIKTLSCSKTIPATAPSIYTQKVVETFDYNEKNQVVVSSKVITYTFTTQDTDYTSIKTNCQTNSNKYLESQKAGYTLSCNSNELSVTVGKEYDLATFKEFTEGTEKITANAKLNESINDVKTRLTSSGYTCE